MFLVETLGASVPLGADDGADQGAACETVHGTAIAFEIVTTWSFLFRNTDLYIKMQLKTIVGIDDILITYSNFLV